MTPPPQPRHAALLRLRTWLSSLALMLLVTGCAGTTQMASQDASSRLTQRSGSAGASDSIAALLASLDQQERGSGLVNPANDFVAQALAHLGTRYAYGGHSPDVGFDCSGLIWFAAKQTHGLKLPRRAADLARLGEQVKRAELRRGDLVFFNTMGRRYSHVGIYLGDGKFVHAPSRGGVVRIDNMQARYWNSRFNGARRITQLTQLASN